MDNMTIYEKSRSVPPEAQKKITGGRLNNMTDINPMWRIKMLTELFGPCGIGWYAQIKEKRTDTGADGSVAAFVDIDLYIMDADKKTWSAPISGTGGSMLVAKERGGLFTSDECFKMAYTDAISVCCKMLGFGADIYWEKDRTKYTQPPTPEPTPKCSDCGGDIKGVKVGGNSIPPEKLIEQTSEAYGRKLCYSCAKAAKAARDSEPA